MRILAFVVSTVISTGLLLGGVTLLVVPPGTVDPLWTLVEILAMIMFVFGPLTIGSFSAFWDVTGSEESRRYYGRVVRVVIGMEVVAAVVTTVFALVNATGPVLPTVFIASGVALTVAALVIGPAVYRYDHAHAPAPRAWVAIEHSQIVKKILTVAITFAGVLIVSLIGLSLVSAAVQNSLGLLEVLVFSLSVAFIFASGACVITTLPWNTRLRDVTERDPSRLRQIAKVVVRNKPIQLDPRDLTAAARYAALISITMSFQLAYLVLLYAGLLLQQIHNLGEGMDDGLSIVVVVFMIVVLVAALPLQVVRIRRARRYARAHAAEMDAPIPS